MFYQLLKLPVWALVKQYRATVGGGKVIKIKLLSSISALRAKYVFRHLQKAILRVLRKISNRMAQFRSVVFRSCDITQDILTG